MIRTLLFVVCVGAGIFVWTANGHAQRRERVFTQPLADLGFVRDRVPDALRSASDGPYAPVPTLSDGRTDCTAISTEIAALNEALGPDLNMQIAENNVAGNLISGAVRSALKLPYRSILRRITGAERRDREYQDAMEAGMVRRAFLKGVSDTSCTGPLRPSDEQQLAQVHLSPTIPVRAFEPRPSETLPAPTMVAHVAPPPAPAPSVQTIAAAEPTEQAVIEPVAARTAGSR